MTGGRERKEGPHPALSRRERGRRPEGGGRPPLVIRFPHPISTQTAIIAAIALRSSESASGRFAGPEAAGAVMIPEATTDVMAPGLVKRAGDMWERPGDPGLFSFSLPFPPA